MIVLGLTDAALAILVGAGFGIGACLLLSLVPRWGAPTLTRRIAPYIRDISDPLGVTAPVALSRSDRRAVWRALQARAGAAFGGSETIARRIDQAGWNTDVAVFRGRQLAWALTGLVGGGVLVVALAVSGRANPAAALLAPLFCVGGAILCDVSLTQSSKARVARIEEELPTVLEFLALCLAAGEGILDSLRRVGDAGAGEFTAELRAVVLAVGTGSTLGDALTRLSRRLQIPAVTRSIDHLVAALDRGAPLAQVLEAQASDAREDAKRGLIERAGRKEIYMLVPLVFLILPLSVLFAVFPGIFMLRLGIE
ncbi:MAG: type II secretion system F family protein [Actinobacteria bacterium]|nr:type II secretion system F family protein [Actinomycetota bacterium]